MDDVFLLVIQMRGEPEACRDLAREIARRAELAFDALPQQPLVMGVNLAKWEPL
jgi:hypothetical protein